MTWNSSPLRLNPPSRGRPTPSECPITPNRVRVFDAAERIGQLNDLAAEPEAYLIAEKHHTALSRQLPARVASIGKKKTERQLVPLFGRMKAGALPCRNRAFMNEVEAIRG